jgi:hypothetical protein
VLTHVLTEREDNMAGNSSNNITRTKAPALVVPPTQYTPDALNQLNNQLRIYFNSVDAANASTIQQVNNLVTQQWLNLGTGIF